MPEPSGLFSRDPLIAQNFFLEIDGKLLTALSSVSGIEMAIETASLDQVDPRGASETIETAGKKKDATELTLTRMAAVDADHDELWQWFLTIRDKGLTDGDGKSRRKNASVVLYEASGGSHAEKLRFNFYNAWPTRIALDQLSADSNEPVKETITLKYISMERVLRGG